MREKLGVSVWLEGENDKTLLPVVQLVCHPFVNNGFRTLDA